MTVTQLHPPHVSESHNDRWIPSRAGILNVWRYYDEVFTFHDGRLLLRGPNGSGKSKALELLLPFLFDANLRASRLSTFGTGERTMHWNLMGEGASGTTRVGYVWLEFAKQSDPHGWYTCGARLQASSHTTTVHADYFTTDLRVQPGGLNLVNELGMPLTRSALTDQLGERGKVHDSATAYRSAIRSTLFPGLSEQRYDALLMALLQLRTPKLSQRLDPGLLSTLLSRALPPLDPQEIADLAEGFERLDAQRERLETLQAEVEAATALARRQSTYAQRVLRAAAATLTAATSELQKQSTLATETANRYEQAVARDARLDLELGELDRQQRRAAARLEGLTSSETYRGGRAMDDLRRQTATAKIAADRALELASREASQAVSDESLSQGAQRDVQTSESVLQRHAGELRQAAVRVDLTAIADELLSRSALDQHEARKLLSATVRAREDQIGRIDSAIRSHEQAVERREDAELDLEQAREELDQAQRAVTTASEHHERELTELVSRLFEWAQTCRELVVPDPSALADDVESEGELRAVVEGLATAVRSDIGAEQRTLRAAIETLDDARDDLTKELEGLEGDELPPAAPPYRAMDRATVQGAPLWQLVDFAPDLPAVTRPLLEAALQASGLLDAWVTPRGDIRLADGHDTFASPAQLTPAVGRSLADVLTPEPGAVVHEDIVRGVLSVVAVDNQLPSTAHAAIGLDGSWRLGALTGSWEKETAAHIGATAREQARERRAAEIQAEFGELNDQLRARKSELDRLGLRLDLLNAELASRPSYDQVDKAARLLARAEIKASSAEETAGRRVGTVTKREGEVASSLRSLTSLAAESGLPIQRSALEDVRRALRSFTELSTTWLAAQAELAAARRRAEDLRSRADRSTESAAEREGEAAEAAATHESLTVRLEAIESSIGQDYREILDEIGELRRRAEDLTTARGRAHGQKMELAREIGELSGRVETATADRDEAMSARDTAALRFRQIAVGTFPADSNLPNLGDFENLLAGSDGVRAALDAARQVTGAWPLIPHAPSNLADALQRLSETVHECRESLRSRADLDLETDEDVQVFSAVVDGLRVGALELLRILRRDKEQSQQEITDQERDLFDRTLTGDTRRHLANRIRQANELVDQMNIRLAQVRTASKVAVQLVWQLVPELSASTKSARDLLLKDPAQLSEDDRESLHRFLRDRVEQARADDTASSWSEQLTQVFDYTAWHHFVVKLDRGKGDGWQPLTRKLHGALSGGEKAIALHLPLFAVVAAHYQSVPDAPRLILLDEVFVGVDSTNRGRVFALLAALDLDLVLTSDHEWCTYAELPGIGIHQLVTAADGDDAVTTARFTWDGHELAAADLSVEDA